MASESALPEVEDFDGVAEVALWLVEEAVDESRADDDGGDECVGEVCGAFGVFALVFVAPS